MSRTQFLNVKAGGRARLKCDGTRAETRFGLSAKRTSSFKLARGSVQSTTGSRGVRISGSNGSNAGYTMFWGRVQDYWLPTPLACSPFTSPTVRHRVPSGFNWALPKVCLRLQTVHYFSSATYSRTKLPEDDVNEHRNAFNLPLFCYLIYIGLCVLGQKVTGQLRVCRIPISIWTRHLPNYTASHPIKRGQGRVYPVRALNAYMGRRVRAPLAPSFGTRWRSMINITPRPVYPQERTPLKIEYEAGWAGLYVLEKRKISCL